MRHMKNTVKLGRTTAQREALFAALLSNLILRKRVRTTLPKARAAKRLADRLVTTARKNTLAAKRQVLARIKNESAMQELFGPVATAMAGRAGGYTRIVKLGKRMSDSSEMCYLEWVDYVPAAPKKKAKKDEGEAK
jgi:large subunit ribosomal protein L17